MNDITVIAAAERSLSNGAGIEYAYAPDLVAAIYELKKFAMFHGMNYDAKVSDVRLEFRAYTKGTMDVTAHVVVSQG